MKRIKSMVALLLCMMLVFPAVVSADTEQTVKSRLTIDKSYEAVRCEAGNDVELVVPLLNKEKYTISHVVVSPVQSADTSSWPFEIETTNLYEEIEGELQSGETGAVTFPLTTREDVTSGYIKLEFQISYVMHISENETTEMETVKSLYVRTVAVTPTATPTPTPTKAPTATPTPTEEPLDEVEEPVESFDDSSYSSGGSSGESLDDEDENGSTPRVILEGFTTNPEEVNAGDTFDLVLKVRNTSKITAVGNMVLTIQSPQAGEEETAAEAFLPVGGASTVYIENIAKNSTKEVTVKLTSRSDLVQKPYPVEIQLKYEDEEANAFEGTLNISIPIKQKARFELSTVQAMPESIMVGEETNVMFDIYNLGKTKLYNVKVKIEDASVANGEAFVGNLEAGATGSVDMMVQGAAESKGDGTVKLLITYEDQDGNQTIYETSCVILVTPAEQLLGDMVFEEDLLGEEYYEETGTSPLVWIVVGLVVVVGAIAAGVVLVKKKRKKDEEWADELLGSDQDELQ